MARNAVRPSAATLARALAAVLFVLLVLVGVANVTPAAASILTVFQGPGCTGAAQTYSCGCHNINVLGGLRFNYTNYLPLALFDADDCNVSFAIPDIVSYELCQPLPFIKSAVISCVAPQALPQIV